MTRSTAAAIAEQLATSLKPRRTRVSAKPGATVLTGAMKAALPAVLAPQLATLAAGIPAAGEWIYEVKFDGYRIMSRIENGKARLITRGAHDWSHKMLGLVAELETLGISSAWLDGEIVILNDKGLPDFSALQKSFDAPENSARIVYFVFDVPFFEGFDLRGVRLHQRRALLKRFFDVSSTEHVRYSADFDALPASILSSACAMQLEGVIGKRADSRYESARSSSWIKLKCKQRQEFVIAGYTNRSDAARQVGSLLLGVYSPDGVLLSAGSVGTGWTAKTAMELKSVLEKIETDKIPFPAGAAAPGKLTKPVTGAERWVTPTLVAEVEFAEWTSADQIRHASFISLRSDKPAKAIVRERAAVVD